MVAIESAGITKSTMSRIQELSNIIATNSRLVDEYLTKSGTPHPSFDYEAPTTLNFPGDIENARTEVLEASLELHELLLGAKELLHTHKVMSFLDKSCFILSTNWRSRQSNRSASMQFITLR